MALRKGCFPLGRLARVATAALISVSTFCLLTAEADAHHHGRHRASAHAPRQVHSAHSARAAHSWRPTAHARHAFHYAHRASPHKASASSGVAAGGPAFSALVVDVNSGRILYSADENGLRHPASITKVMTLYLLFEELDRGAITPRTQIPISEHAAAQQPSKLGLPAGDTISVEDAIKAVVTRSANDIAVAIAEAIGGSESNFAELMTRQARALGMTGTVYVNASGLPDDRQITTAHDLAILGRSVEERFPRYFHYFSIPEFAYEGEIIGNHDHLLRRVEGVDGIKTGYTRASGFNLLTSVHRDGRSLIAVVMGGRSAAGRDRIMENLIADHIAEASTARTATVIADATPAPAIEPRVEPAVASPLRARATEIAEAKLERISATARAANAAGEGDDAAGDEEIETQEPVLEAPAPAPRATAAKLGLVKGPEATKPSAKIRARLAAASALVMPPDRPEIAAGDEPRSDPPSGQDEASDEASGRGWMVQIGAPDNLAKAHALLDRARDRNRSILAAAKPITEKVRKGDSTLYRARFAGLDSASAEAACRSLKRTGFSCFTAHD
ncbi:MAG TPA: SPOR domain-containing protein [Roseiarcus sp.]|nr:SPOR domain-containing protein [Roseiarcus sp.]